MKRSHKIQESRHTGLMATVSLPFLLLAAMAFQRGATGEVIHPNDKVQEQIRTTIQAIAKMRTPTGAEAAYRELDELKNAVGGQGKPFDRVTLVRQLVYFQSKARDDTEAILPLKIIELIEIPDFIVVEALAPYVTMEETRMAGLIRARFETIDGVEPFGTLPLVPPNYSVYLEYIAHLNRNDEQIPRPFVTYIFMKSPGDALLAFTYAKLYAAEWREERTRPILWSEHVVRDALWKKEHHFHDGFQQAKRQASEELGSLSHHEQWWVRLYVAEIVDQHPEFRTQELVERLKDDKHELVRQATMREKPEPKPKRGTFPPSPPPAQPGPPLPVPPN